MKPHDLGEFISLSLIYLVIVTPVICFLEVQRDYSQNVEKEFTVYWNVPTKNCKKYGFDFEPLLAKFKIVDNAGDEFRGGNITLLYDPGEFPIVKEDPKTHELHEENGGIPQKGNLTLHLKKLRETIDKLVPKNFSGLGVIDFETWRPIFRQNWNKQMIYKILSLEHAAERHPNATEKEIHELAKNEFEDAARLFMEATLEEIKKMRPRAKWGYYGYPYCYNFRGAFGNATCPQIAVKENDQLSWLFEASTALYPSVYLSEKLTQEERTDFMIGYLNEAIRVSQSVGFKNVYAYTWFKYIEEDHYLSYRDLFYTMEVARIFRMGGVIVWGKSVDTNNENKCRTLYNYVNDTLGPALEQTRSNEHSFWKALINPFVFTFNYVTNWFGEAFNSLFYS